MYSRKQIENIAATCYEQAQAQKAFLVGSRDRCAKCPYHDGKKLSTLCRSIIYMGCNPDWLHITSDHPAHEEWSSKIECLIDPLLDVIEAVQEAEDVQQKTD